MLSSPATLLRLLCAFLLTLPGWAFATGGAVGDRVPVSQFCAAPEDAAGWSDAPKLIVLAPEHSDYDGMLRMAFDQYFRNQHAFAGEAVLPGIKVVHVTGAGILPFLFNKSDCPGATSAEALATIAAATGVSLPKAENTDATVLLLDKDDVVRWRDDHYRAQGEHLKPLEAAVKAVLGRRDTLAIADPAAANLAIGDMAPDVQITTIPPAGTLQTRATAQPRALSSLRGKVVLLTFYPAAFSGTLPTVEGDVESMIRTRQESMMHAMMRCSLQLSEIDKLPVAPKLASNDVVKLAITSSTPELLSEWANVLGTHDLHYVNDRDYAISRRYGSYDARAGYNLRKVFIVGRDGRIAFIDDDYTVDDAAAVAQALERASAR